MKQGISIAVIYLSAVLLFVGCSNVFQAENFSNGSTPMAPNSLPKGSFGKVIYGMVTVVNGNSVTLKVASAFNANDTPPPLRTLDPNALRQTHNPNAPSRKPRPARTVPPNAEEETVIIPDTAIVTRRYSSQNGQKIKASDIQPGEMVTIMYGGDDTTISLVDVVSSGVNGQPVQSETPVPSNKR